MGGGVLLLSFMSLVLPYHILIPVHGFVQFVSNSSRAWLLRKSLNFKIYLYFLLGIPFGSLLAYNILRNIHASNIYYLLLGSLILYVVVKPKKLPSVKLNHIGWFFLGIFASTLGPIIGATGPLLAVFYVRDDMQKEEIISTKAIQQLTIHLIKIPLFLSLSFPYLEHINLLLIMSAGVFTGTFFGVKILKKIDNELFRKIFKFVLFLTSMRLFYKYFQTLV